ncbi:MAG: hypothetical protein NTX61_17640 [Bacteroidetes bacterium]|nr:hypothetical protein [Bacteroidota bacterium]
MKNLFLLSSGLLVLAGCHKNETTVTSHVFIENTQVYLAINSPPAPSL